MFEKRFFGFTEFSDWVSAKLDGILLALTGKLDANAQAADSALLGGVAVTELVSKTDDFGQYRVGELELAVLLADIASGADLQTLQAGFNDFVAAKATAAEAVAGLDDVKYLTAVGAKAAIEQAVNDLVGSAPEALNTIVELATALENNPDIITNLTTLVGQKLDATATAVNSSKLEGSTKAQVVSEAVIAAETALVDDLAGKLGTAATAANSSKLEGSTKAQVVAQAVTAAETALADDLAGKLGTTAQAADSAKLEGRSKAEVMADTKTFLALGTASKSDIFVSTVDPISTDGKDGDLWIKYTP